MSELSEKFAVSGGNRRKYCQKIGVYITTCILDKTCEECNGVENTKKPQNKSKTTNKYGETMPEDKLINQVNIPKKNTNEPIKGGETNMFTKIRTRVPRTKRACEHMNDTQVV